MKKTILALTAMFALATSALIAADCKEEKNCSEGKDKKSCKEATSCDKDKASCPEKKKN